MADERFRVSPAAECHDIGGKLEAASPAVERIMISVDDEDRDIPLGQPFRLLAKRHERPQAPILRIIKITGNDQEIRFGGDGVIDNPLEGPQCRRLQTVL